MLECERGQLIHQLGAMTQSQPRVDCVLRRREPELLQPGGGWLEELLVRDVHQRRPTPQRKCLMQRLYGSGLVVGQRGAAGRSQSLEPGHVDPVRVNHQAVSSWM